MPYRPHLVTAALTVSAALILTACGGGPADEGGDDDRIVGAETGGAAGTDPTASPSRPAPRTGRPTVALPSSFRVEFENWTNSDPQLQAILDDGKEELRSEYAAIIEADPRSEALAFYNTGASLKSARKWVQGFVGADHTLVGEGRVFAPQVHLSDEGFGVLFYCVDESKGYTKNRKTGEKKGTPKGTDPRLQYRTRLDKSEQGVWRTTTVETERGAC
ncbi:MULTISPECIES: hypothetical protein [unclassified Streptomyces]|uniref:hypothetical protein n=1 Tax=unclassified Streptomyces TaxID=2593676 RepID=UPI0033F9C779